MSKTKQIQKETKDPSIIALAEEADIVRDIKALYDTPGGKRLVELLVKDIVGSVHRLTASKPEEREELIAQLKSNLSLARLIVNAEDSEKHLDEMIADALTE